MISLTLSLALSTPGIRPQNAPPMKPATAITVNMMTMGVSGDSQRMATPVARNAPMKSCPSAPMFHSRMRNAIDTPSPARIRGVALMVVSDQP